MSKPRGNSRSAGKQVPGHDTRHVRLPKNHCFACGRDNPDGMRLRFYLDQDGRTFVCRFRLGRRYQGPPGHAHGGIIATILDEAMGKVNRLRSVIALTREMQVEYLKPVPLGRPLLVESQGKSVRGRRHTNVAEIRDRGGQVLARGRAVFIALDRERLKRFAGLGRLFALAPKLVYRRARRARRGNLAMNSSSSRRSPRSRR